MILMATSRCRRESRARYTSPIPPAPSGDRISYGPSFEPEVRTIPASDYSLWLRPYSRSDDSGCMVASLDRKRLGALVAFEQYFPKAQGVVDDGLADDRPTASTSTRGANGLRREGVIPNIN